MVQSFFSSRLSRILVIVFLFGAALAIRLYDLTDLPLDFHPTRQLLSFIKARGLYYETEPDGVPKWKLQAARQEAKLKADVEPAIFEHIVAFTYRFTGEQIWVARVYSSIFWLVGGIFLFLLVRDLISFDGAMVSLAYYLFFPYAIFASRSFQPDPLMVMLFLAFWWMIYKWTSLTLSPSPNGKGAGVRVALLAGLVGGFAIYIKLVAAFFVIGSALGMTLGAMNLRVLIRNAQVWMMAALGILPAAIYLIYGVFISGFLTKMFNGRFIASLIFNPLTYLDWETKAGLAAGGLFIMLGLLGFFFTQDKRVRIFLYGLWGAYLLFGLYFDYHIATHDYYHLPLISVVAVSLGPLGSWLFARLAESTSSRRMRSVVYVILIFGMFSTVWAVRDQMKSVDYRPQAAMWNEIGDLIRDDNTIALTQDYGSRLQYWGWMTASIWPSSGDLYYADVRGDPRSFGGMFDAQIAKKDFFLVTDFDEFKRQPQLKERLSSYPIFAQDDGYVIYDLR